MRGSSSTVLLIVTLAGCASAEVDTDTETPPAQSVNGVPYWSSGSATDEGKSTHLWIVDHAVAILGAHQSLPRAAHAFARMTSAACATRWKQGLDDADHKVSYNNWYTWTSHFYDPSTGTNYTGASHPIAYDEALSHLASARAKLGGGDVYNGCYELGLSLHYATDITQPMHAANYAATDWPLDLHSHLEDRAVAIQSPYAVPDWTGAPSGTVNATLSAIAWASNGKWPGMWSALANAYASRCSNINGYYIDHTSCWSGDAGVDAAIGAALRDAQTATAAYIYAADVP